jgi:hypothetical protein
MFSPLEHLNTEVKLLATESAPQTGYEALRSIESDWCAAGFTWNVDSLVDIYTSDALLFGGQPGLAVGHAAIRAYFSSYRGILDSTRLQLYDQNLIELDSNMFIAQGYGIFTFHFADGRITAPVSRTTLLMVREQKRWKVKVHHFSAEI